MNVYVACPKKYSPNPQVLKEAEANAKRVRDTLKIVPTVKQAVANADIIYTDTWVSMGEDKEAKKREKVLKPYQVNSKVLALAKRDCLVMHCLPAHRGHEITDEVMDGPNSVVFDQAENRLHVQKAILSLLLTEPKKQVFKFSEL
jgi:ornithine carbamoyltransferase